jgi:3-dehydroquinate dehydratase I
MNICACITEKSLNNSIDLISSLKNVNIDLIEHRLDFIRHTEDLNVSNLKKIYSSIKKPIIATCKKENHFSGDNHDIAKVLMNAINAGCDFIDIDINMDDSIIDKLISKANQSDVKIILSWHDYKKTPTKKELIKILLKQEDKKADIYKIVTTSNSLDDNKVILSLYDEIDKLIKNEKLNSIKKINVNNKVKLIAFAMGTKGKITRINALKKGALFMYASVNKKSAPGQLTVDEMRGLLK